MQSKYITHTIDELLNSPSTDESFLDNIRMTYNKGKNLDFSGLSPESDRKSYGLPRGRSSYFDDSDDDFSLGKSKTAVSKVNPSSKRPITGPPKGRLPARAPKPSSDISKGLEMYRQAIEYKYCFNKNHPEKVLEFFFDLLGVQGQGNKDYVKTLTCMYATRYELQKSSKADQARCLSVAIQELEEISKISPNVLKNIQSHARSFKFRR